jgi:hypothetical protein
LFVHGVVSLVGADKLHVVDLKLENDGHVQPVVIALVLRTTLLFFTFWYGGTVL